MPPDPTRRGPGDYSRSPSKIDGTTIDTPEGTTRLRQDRSPLATYMEGRERVLGGRPKIAGNPTDGARDLVEACGPAGAQRYTFELVAELRSVPAEVVIDLAAVPRLAAEAADARDDGRRAELLAQVERAVVDAVAILQRCAS